MIPMLPRELSNGICSLNAGTDRLALSCMMDVDDRGNVVDHKITESIIHVDRRMSYTGIEAVLEGKEHPEGDREDIVALCFLMKEAAAVLKEKRRKRGAIDFDFPEAKILVDEKGYPTDIHPYEREIPLRILLKILCFLPMKRWRKTISGRSFLLCIVPMRRRIRTESAVWMRLSVTLAFI